MDEQMLGEVARENAWQRKVLRLEAALRFYSDERNWQMVGFVEPPTSAIKADGGKKAREALAPKPHDHRGFAPWAHEPDEFDREAEEDANAERDS